MALSSRDFDERSRYALVVACSTMDNPWVQVIAQGDDKEELKTIMRSARVAWPNEPHWDRTVMIVNVEENNVVFKRKLQ
jgi:hypothetical protein